MKKQTVTPKTAIQWLSRNIKNRPLSKRAVKAYAEAMRDGQWKLNGDCIRFNSNGDLIDGQHRLHACVESGVSFQTYVIKGLDTDAFDTIDQGNKRSISDVFAKHGYKSYSTLAACVRWCFWCPVDGGYRSGQLRPDQAHQIVEDNPGIQDAVAATVSIVHTQSGSKLINPGLLAFLILRSSQVAEESEAVRFWNSVMHGEELRRGSPGHQLHKRLTNNLLSKAKLDKTVIAALCIKAWNAHFLQQSVNVLKWQKDEEFPVFALRA